MGALELGSSGCLGAVGRRDNLTGVEMEGAGSLLMVHGPQASVQEPGQEFAGICELCQWKHEGCRWLWGCWSGWALGSVGLQLQPQTPHCNSRRCGQGQAGQGGGDTFQWHHSLVVEFFPPHFTPIPYSRLSFRSLCTSASLCHSLWEGWGVPGGDLGSLSGVRG